MNPNQTIDLSRTPALVPASSTTISASSPLVSWWQYAVVLNPYLQKAYPQRKNWGKILQDFWFDDGKKHQKTSHFRKFPSTLPETNIAPENRPFEKEIRQSVSFRKGTSIPKSSVVQNSPLRPPTQAAARTICNWGWHLRDLYLSTYRRIGRAKKVENLSGCFNTPLEHTPKPLPRGYSGTPFIVGQGDWLGCALGTCCNFLGKSNPQKVHQGIITHKYPRKIGLM